MVSASTSTWLTSFTCREVRRLVVCEKPDEIRKRRSEAFAASKDVQEQAALAEEIVQEIIDEETA
jgi:hypothetical protein